MTDMETVVYNSFCVENAAICVSGCGSAWLERLVWDQEAAGSNPVTPMNFIFSFVCGCSSMVEHQPSKLDTWVRFPSPAFLFHVFQPGQIPVEDHSKYADCYHREGAKPHGGDAAKRP